MRKNELLLKIYLMKERQACLVLKGSGKPCKILNLLEVLPFVGHLKQLSKAIDTGAGQDCSYPLQNADGFSCRLICRFMQEVVALEFWFKEKLKFSWRGTAREFAEAVAAMICTLPRFF